MDQGDFQIICVSKGNFKIIKTGPKSPKSFSDLKKNQDEKQVISEADSITLKKVEPALIKQDLAPPIQPEKYQYPQQRSVKLQVNANDQMRDSYVNYNSQRPSLANLANQQIMSAQNSFMNATMNALIQNIQGSAKVEKQVAKNSGKQKKKLSLLEKASEFKKQIIFSIGLFVGLIILGAVLEAVLSRPNINQSENKKDVTPAPNPTPNPGPIIFSCSDNPTECSGIAASVIDFISSNFTQPDQARAVIQMSRSLNLISAANANATRQTLIESFRNITRSAQCMAYNIPNGIDAFQTLTELQFGTESQIQQYLSLAEAFSGQPLRLSSLSTVEGTCRFNLTSGRRRRLQQNQSRVGSANCTQNNSVLIYFNGIGYSPSAAIQNVWKMQEILGTDSRAHFDAGIVALGAWRNGNLGYSSTIIQDYQFLLQSLNQSAVARIDLLSCLRMIINLCNQNYRLPQSITSSNYRRFRSFYVRRSMQSYYDQQYRYLFDRHQQFVIQQINQGKKVVLLAHAEGSYYANRVYNLLTSTQKLSVSLVYVAPTVSSMADGRSNYITNPSDYVISQLRTYASSNGSFLAPLPANSNPATFNSDLDFGFNHDLAGYADAYKQNLLQLIADAKSRAVQPSRLWGSGPLTVTLSWDIQPDLDLHIFQPNSHVFYAHKIGNNGYLDIDDTSSYGPQHYYTNCTLETGSYTVKVNFYYGTGTSTAIVTVAAGTEYYMKSFSFQPYQTQFICTVVVSWNSGINSNEFSIVT